MHLAIFPRALCHDDAKQHSVMYITEFGVTWKNVHVLHLYGRVSVASAFFAIRVFGDSATFGLSQSSQRYHLVWVQHARVCLAISVDIFRSSIMAFPRQVKEGTCLLVR